MTCKWRMALSWSTSSGRLAFQNKRAVELIEVECDRCFQDQAVGNILSRAHTHTHTHTHTLTDTNPDLSWLMNQDTKHSDSLHCSSDLLQPLSYVPLSENKGWWNQRALASNMANIANSKREGETDRYRETERERQMAPRRGQVGWRTNKWR